MLWRSTEKRGGVMRRSGELVLVGAILCAAVAVGVAATEPQIGFGGGGPGFGIFMPPLTAINTFVSEAGYAPFDGDLALIGGGGRGGVAPGPVFGGAGWGAWITSRRGDFNAEYGVGLGGFDAGYGVGGSSRSVLTVGTLLGAGGAEVILTEHTSVPLNGLSPRAIVVEPTVQTYDCFFVFAAPYVDVQIQILEWMGFGLRAGYVWSPLEINWQDDGPLDAPSLAPSGLFIRFSIMFGGIGTIEDDGPDN
jgi:hypothetical protein